MTSQQLQYLKDTQEKAIKVVDSCKTKAQLRGAKKYITLLGARYTQEFDLNELFKVNPKDYHLCKDIHQSLELKIQFKKLSVKSNTKQS